MKATQTICKGIYHKAPDNVIVILNEIKKQSVDYMEKLEDVMTEIKATKEDLAKVMEKVVAIESKQSGT